MNRWMTVTSVLLAGLASVASHETDYWTAERRQAHTLDNANPDRWDLELLADDLIPRREKPWPTQPAMSYRPSPVAHYDTPGGSLRNLSIEIEGKTLTGYSVGWGRGAFNEHQFDDPGATWRTYLSILILTDREEPKDRAAHIVSRNHPHYLASGTQRTSVGDIDWLHLALAGGEDVAVVSGRVFDLAFGNVILVAPHQDGSVRYLQWFDDPGDDVETFANRVKENEVVRDLVTAAEAL